MRLNEAGNWGRENGRLLLAAATVFGVALAVYAWTMAPTVTFVDSGELIVAARTLGNAHPPGFPLYLLLAHLATMMPIGNVAARVNFASALFGALAAAAMALVCHEASLLAMPSLAAAHRRERQARPGGRSKERVRPAADRLDAARSPAAGLALAPAPALVSGLLLAFSRTLWSYATVAEVYTLNTFLILLIIFLMFRWRQRSAGPPREKFASPITGAKAPDPRRGFSVIAASSGAPHADRWLYTAALVFGLALGVHHVTVGLMLPALALFVYSTSGISFFKSRRLACAALIALAGLSVYAYLPLAASRSPALNWGDPRTLQRIWWHVTGRQYRVNLGFTIEVMGREAAQFFRLAARQFGPPWLPVAPLLTVAGFARLFRNGRATFWFLALIALATLAFAFSYDIADDKDAYYLPLFAAAAVAAGLGVQWFLDLLATNLRRAAPSSGVILAGVLGFLVPAAAFAGNFPFNNRRHYTLARDYADNIFSTVGRHGMLLTRDWQVYSPMLYAREVEQDRRDAVVIDLRLLRRSWYLDYLRRAYPELMEETRDKVEDFLQDLRQWEQDPETLNRDPAFVDRLSSRYYEMILALVTVHLRHFPVYVTSYDIEGISAGEDAELTASLRRSYQFVPQGLVFQLTADRAFHEPEEPELQTRGLADGTIKFEADDVVRLKVWPVYRNMLVNRARYLAAYGHHQRAIRPLGQALLLDPGFAPARELLKASEAAMGAATRAPAGR